MGCGEGILARALRAQVPVVTGIDRHEPSIAHARASAADIAWVLGDVLTTDLRPADVVASVAMLHHVDTHAALRRLGALVNPGGRLLVVGCARRELPHDLPWELAGAAKDRLLRLRHCHWQHSAPIVDASLTHRETKQIVVATLPGASYRQLAMWRYFLDWTPR